MSHVPLHIVVGLSGGVDSAVAAYLLQQAGHKVTPIFMKNWQDDDGQCPAEQDLHDAQAVCDRLKLPLQVVNFATEYWQRVFTHFLNELAAGRTPNPDILCNKEIKFKAFLHYAKQLGADKIATGHYARIEQQQLLKAQDLSKDQSYFLYALDQTQLAHSIFPLGELSKTQVRSIARSLALPNHNKKDSTGICFIGERKFKPFLQQYLLAQPGRIEAITGEQLGQHDGLLFYTIGQRQGLGIGGKRGAKQAPWYVAAKDIKRNVLVVVQGEHPALYKQNIIVHTVHWIKPIDTFPLHISAKTRYRQADQACTVIPLAQAGLYQVQFQQPQRAITPGQAIVFYQDNVCLGGGPITE